MPKRDIQNHKKKFGSALLNPNKKLSKEVSKAIKKTIEKEDIVKSNILTTIITVLTVAVSSYVFVFQVGGQYKDINNGIETNSKQLSELIEINKNSVKRVSALERTVDKVEIYTNLNTERIKDLRK
jgi:cell division protein FtsL